MRGILVLCCCLLLPALAHPDPGFNWAAIYDGANLDDSGLFVTTDPAGNPVVAGLSHDGVEGSDIVVRMLDAGTGDEIWLERIPAFDESDMMVSGIAWDPQGDLIVGGHISGCVG
jgi:hypothetical protein